MDLNQEVRWCYKRQQRQTQEESISEYLSDKTVYYFVIIRLLKFWMTVYSPTGYTPMMKIDYIPKGLKLTRICLGISYQSLVVQMLYMLSIV